MKRRSLSFFSAVVLLSAIFAGHAAQAAEQDREIILVRSGGSRRDPEYQVTVRSDGTVEYVGRAHVYFVGRRNKTISPAGFERLWAAVDAASFWKLADKYDTLPKTQEGKVSLGELPQKEITVVDGERRKHVLERSGAPPELGELEAMIDFETNTTQWVKGPPPDASG